MVERVITEADGGVTFFDEWGVAEFTPIFELDSANGLTALRDKQTTANGGTIAQSSGGGEIQLSTGTTANGSATLDTGEKGRYQPGVAAIAGIAIRRPVAPTGNQFWEAGYFDDTDGYWIGEDSTGLYVRMRVGGVDRDKVREADWDSGGNVELDFTKVQVLRLPHICYYGGPLRIEVMETSDGRVKKRTLHSFGSVSGEPILQQSKLPVRAYVDNGGDTNNLDIFVGGRHYGIDGRYNPNRRETAERRLSYSLTETFKPVISFRKRDVRSELAKSCKLSGVAVLCDADAITEIQLNPTLATAGNFNAVSGIATAESAVFSDIVTTGITSAGQVLDRSVVSGGSGNRSNFAGIRRLGLDIPDDATVTLAARVISGTGTMTAVFSVEEEW